MGFRLVFSDIDITGKYPGKHNTNPIYCDMGNGLIPLWTFPLWSPNPDISCQEAQISGLLRWSKCTASQEYGRQHRCKSSWILEATIRNRWGRIQVTDRVKRKRCALSNVHIDGLVQDCGNPTTNALELLQSCTKPSIRPVKYARCVIVFCLVVVISMFMDQFTRISMA